MRPFLVAVACLLAPLPAAAARLPFRAYGAGEGLEGSYVRSVMQDSRGFLWVATNAGVSRFDGHEFRNYGAADGLPFPSARKIIETKDGGLIVLGRGKLARRAAGFATAGPEFAAVAPPGLVERAGDLYDVNEAPDGSLVVAGTRGVARLSGDRVEAIDLGPTPFPDLEDADRAWGAAFDGTGALWVARTYGITRVGPEGKAKTVLLDPPRNFVSSGWGWLPSMNVDASERVWLLTISLGAWRLEAAADGAPTIAEKLEDPRGPSGLFLRSIHETSDGTLWVATANSGLTRVERTASGWSFTPIAKTEGFPDLEVSSVLVDAQGNLWAGTAEGGLVRLARDGLTAWTQAEGLSPSQVAAIVDDPEGGVLVLLANMRIAAIRDGVLEAPRDIPGVLPTWGGIQMFATDADGRLWLATAHGVAMWPRGTRIRDLRSTPPAHILGTSDGLPGEEVHRVFATRNGTIWFGMLHTRSGLCRIEPDGTRARCFGPDDGLPEPTWCTSLAEDREGNIWAGLYNGGVFRYRDGTWESWPEISPERQTTVQSIRIGREGRLWVTGSPGLLRIDDPTAERPSFRRLTQDDGLVAADTLDVAEDRFGDLYVAGPRGIDRIGSEGRVVRRYTSADGLPANRITMLHADANGDLWAGSQRGIARFVPERAGTAPPPTVYLTSATVEGRTRSTAGPLDLGSDERTVEFGFAAPSFRAGETMRFQWRLGSHAWSAPSTARTIVLAGLAPGGYRFEVRAVDGEGQASAPARVAFRIRPPFWRQGWFLVLAAAAAVTVVYAVYRARVARLLELERVRMRIATDLHDDVGASLSQIAVLSQYASRQAARGGEEARGSLARITELSGSVVDAMSDVVWSINPARDRMSDLVHRMRRFAVDLFSETEVALSLELPADDADEPLSPEVRRQVFLIFKEALHNAARHAQASAIRVSFRRERDGLELLVADDGRGISANPTPSSGLGLTNMRRRAAGIGGTLDVSPGPGGGTDVRLRLPLASRYLSKWRGTSGSRAS